MNAKKCKALRYQARKMTKDNGLEARTAYHVANKSKYRDVTGTLRLNPKCTRAVYRELKKRCTVIPGLASDLVELGRIRHQIASLA